MTRSILPFFFALVAAAIGRAAASDPATLQFLEQRVQADPLDFIAQNRLSSAYVGQMRESGDLAFLDRALVCAHASLTAVPAEQNAGGVSALAVAEFESHHFREALELARRARTLDPRNSTALATIGDAELELGDYPAAEQTYREFSSGSDGPAVQARLARLAELQGDNEEATALLARCVDQDNRVAWYHVRLGEIYFRTGRLDLAAPQYDAARALQPDSYLVLEHEAELSAAQGRSDEAIALYRSVVDRLPRGEFLQALGDLYTFLGRPAEAAPWYDRALAAYLRSVEQGNAHYYHHLAGFYSDARENPTEALRWARRDLEVRHSVYAHDSLAWALYRDGQFVEAATEMERALALGTKDAHLLFHAGMIFSRAGDLTRGRALLQEALSVNPRYNSFHVHR